MRRQQPTDKRPIAGFSVGDMKSILSDRTKMIDASGIRKVFALAATLKDPVNFSIGQPDFDVPEPAKEAAINAIRRGQNKYSQTAGDNALIEKISGRLGAEFGWPKTHVLITGGVSGGLLLAFMALINPGDEVIIPDPYFVIYKHVVTMLGGKCVYINTYPTFNILIDNISSIITYKTKLIILNSPCNPTGAVYSREHIKEIAGLASKYDIPILSDEIYDEFCYDGDCPSVAQYYDNTLVLRGFSKTYGMTGWRLGFAAASDRLADLIEQMTRIQQYTFVCAPTPFQQAAVAALDCDISKYVADYRRKRDMIYDGLKDKFEIIRPAGAFYAFAKAPGKSGTEFVNEAIKNNVLIIPGSVFSQKDTHFRISYATSDEKIAQGIEILRRLA